MMPFFEVGKLSDAGQLFFWQETALPDGGGAGPLSFGFFFCFLVFAA